MSAQERKDAGPTAPITPLKPEGGLLGSLRRFFRGSDLQSIQQPVLRIVQPPPGLEDFAISLPQKNEDTSSQSASPDSGESLDLTAELNGIINGKIDQNQEALRQQEEKRRQEEEERLRKADEEIRRRAEGKTQVLSHNERAREIAMISGMREFFYQAHGRLVQDYPSAIIEEGWGGFSGRRLPQCELSQALSDEVFRDYFIRLVWKDKIGANGPIDRKSDEYQYAEVICGASHDDLTFNQKKTIDTKRNRFSDERNLTKDEWQNPEEVKKAVVESIKSSLHHSEPSNYPPTDWYRLGHDSLGFPRDYGGGGG